MIKNIIFDVGGVLLEYRWKDMLTDHGLSGEEALKVGRLMFDDPLWTDMDKADRSRDEAIIAAYMEKYPEYAGTIQWFLTHVEYMHVPRKEIWRLVHRLKEKGYRLYILSNYPETMFRKHTDDADFMADMDGEVVSYQIRKVKPDPEIYRHLLDKYHLVPEECLFFDDRPENTRAAERLGIHTVTVTSREFLKGKLEEMCGDMPKETKHLYFTRHGQTVWNVENKICGVTDIGLTELGREQARQLGQKIREQNLPIDEILCSPLCRAADTAAEIRAETGIPVRVEERLREQNYGKYEGTARDGAEFRKAKSHFIDSFENGETMLKLAQRVYNLLDEIRQEDGDKTYLLVAHNGITRVVQSYFSDMSNQEYALSGIDNCEILEFEFERQTKQLSGSGRQREVKVRELTERDVPGALRVWNEVVEQGLAFPQEEELNEEQGRAFFAGQSFVGIAEDGESGDIVGVYILHPNNVGRCGHIANASYAVREDSRGQHIGEQLVVHCMAKARESGFRILQFNAVVRSNAPALALYEKLGFVQMGVIPGGFRRRDGAYEDIIPHYISLGE